MPPPEEFTNHGPSQRINKIPNMEVMCFKSTFFQALNQMQTLFPSYYHFYPKTFMLPHQFTEFQKEHVRLSGKYGQLTWILKPQSGCCGCGIRLVQNPFDIVNESAPAVIQQYVSPYLINGFKFDFRFYLLITDLQPLTVFIYKEGIARFCTKKYRRPTKSNLKEKFCHITNTAINVENDDSQNTDFTRPASEVIKEIETDDLWERIKNISVLTIIALYPQIMSNVTRVNPNKGKGGIDPLHRYFHILGIDVMITENGDPCVLELNDRPSMKVTFPFEEDLKKNLVIDTLNLVKVDGGTAPEVPGSGWQKILPVDDNNGLSKVMRAMQKRSFNVFGPKGSISSLTGSSKQIIYPKPIPDKMRLLMRSYRSHYQ